MGEVMDYEYIFELLNEVRKVPYPEIKVEKKNLELANYIYDDYSGKVSELTAITKYVYQHITFEDKELSDVLGKIAVVEMRHLDILGNIICELGRLPYYVYSDSFMPWTANNVYYEIKDIKAALKNDLLQEQEAIDGYKMLLQITNDANIQENVKRIIMDEEVHKRIFEYLLKNIDKIKERDV